MNLRDLRYLVALADAKHFGKAAAACHVSQPTLSAQIKKLEDYLGVKLLERHSRGMTLTEVGQELVERARGVLRDADEIVNLARDFRDPLAGKLCVALIPTVGPYLLPLVAKRLRNQLPRLRLMLYEYRTEPLLARLQSGDIDVGIIAVPAGADGTIERELYREDFMVALPPQHALAHKASVKISELSGEPLLLLEDGHCLRDQALEVCSRIDVNENQDYRATSLETLRQMVAAGWGATLLPKLATTGPFAADQGALIKPIAKPVPHRVVGAIWRKSSTRTVAIKAVCDVIAEAVK
ncbi:MAG TPA: LysR substrate-binding domain-containing protein [Steroidobacteraceae bacterium]|nr:LysR substrate-binding domain-containing protein [Steroidobacteraceae bacterium]